MKDNTQIGDIPINVGTKLKIIYVEAIKTEAVDPDSKVKVSFGIFQGTYKHFLVLQYEGSEDKFFINEDSIVIFSEVKLHQHSGDLK